MSPIRYFTALASSAAEAAKAQLTMVTYNLLASKYATGGMHSNCPPQFLDMAYRGPRIIQELLGYDADILCLQEVDRPFFEQELQPALGSRGYEALYYGRAVRPSDFIKGPEEGIALVYRSGRLTRIASSTVRLGDLVDRSLTGGFWDRVRNLQDGVVWSLLHDNQAGLPLLVGCTHLFWDPHWPDVKVAQAHLVCKAAYDLLIMAGMPAMHSGSLGGSPGARLRASPPATPVLLGGDFNSLPYKLASDQFDTVPQGSHLVSGVYQLLREGSLGPSHQDHPAKRRAGEEASALDNVTFTTSGLQLHSALAAAWGCDPPVTNKTPSFAGCLDYVWISQQHWDVVGALDLPYAWEKGQPADPAQVQDLPPIPNQDFVSDHLAVGARLVLRSQEG